MDLIVYEPKLITLEIRGETITIYKRNILWTAERTGTITEEIPTKRGEEGKP